MGLRKRHDSAPEFTLGTIRHWHIALTMGLVSVLIAATGDAGRELLKYDRLAILDGDYYRFVSAHFTHLGVGHLALNLAGLALVWLLVGRYRSAMQWLLITSASIGAISAGFWFIETGLLWYVGLSGILHGLLAAGALAGLRFARSESLIILGALAAKLAWEQLVGAMPASASLSGGEVVVDAHLYGALGGISAGLILWHRAVGRASI